MKHANRWHTVVFGTIEHTSYDRHGGYLQIRDRTGLHCITDPFNGDLALDTVLSTHVLEESTALYHRRRHADGTFSYSLCYKTPGDSWRRLNIQ